MSSHEQKKSNRKPKAARSAAASSDSLQHKLTTPQHGWEVFLSHFHFHLVKLPHTSGELNPLAD